MDPVEPRPSTPLIESYSYQSPLPPAASSSSSVAHPKLQPGAEEAGAGTERDGGVDARQEAEDEYWIMGIDEAGRGRESVRVRMQARGLKANLWTDTPLVAAFFRAILSLPH